MFISKRGVEQMILQIVRDPQYGTPGHHGREGDMGHVFVERVGEILTKMPDELYIPDDVRPFVRDTLLGDVLDGYGRPLSCLCTDCRYPKWMMTPTEVMARYAHIPTYVERAKNPRPDGFVNVTLACPKCGD